MELNLLCIDINTREPAAKSRMRMVPADNHLWSATQETNINEFINQTSHKLGHSSILNSVSVSDTRITRMILVGHVSMECPIQKRF